MTLEDGNLVIKFHNTYTIMAGETMTIINDEVVFLDRKQFVALTSYYDWDNDWRKLQPRHGLIPWILRLLWRLP